MGWIKEVMGRLDGDDRMWLNMEMEYRCLVVREDVLEMFIEWMNRLWVFF